MHKFIRYTILAAVLAMYLGAPSAAAAQAPWPPICQEGSLPSHDPKYPADQLILTCIPPNWNGSLVMYAHGYVPEQLPLALPYEELSGSEGMLEAVLGEGFAFATTRYHKNSFTVEQARKDLNDLIKHSKTLVAPEVAAERFPGWRLRGRRDRGLDDRTFPGPVPERFLRGERQPHLTNDWVVEIASFAQCSFGSVYKTY